MKSQAVVGFIPIAVIALLFGFYLNQAAVPKTVIPPFLGITGKNYSPPVELQNFEFCPSNCLYPSPFIEGNVLINYSSPMISMQFWINGVSNGATIFQPPSNPGGPYIYQFKGTSRVPIIAHDVYNITFTIRFANGFNYTTSTVVTP